MNNRMSFTDFATNMPDFRQAEFQAVCAKAAAMGVDPQDCTFCPAVYYSGATFCTFPDDMTRVGVNTATRFVFVQRRPYFRAKFVNASS